MNTLSVRQAVLADLDALVPLFNAYRQFYDKPSNTAAVREFLLARFNHGESVIFIAEMAGNAVGFTQLYPSFSSVSMRRIFVLNDLFVAESARKQMAGAKLLQAAVEYAKTVVALRLALSTAITNTTAQSLYESTGWKRDTQFLHYEYAIPS